MTFHRTLPKVGKKLNPSYNLFRIINNVDVIYIDLTALAMPFVQTTALCSKPSIHVTQVKIISFIAFR